jgi:hypothetical protein
MRHQWFEHVAKTRKKLSKGLKKPVAHREAMRAASESWPARKAKLIKKQKRAAKVKKLREPIELN